MDNEMDWSEEKQTMKKMPNYDLDNYRSEKLLQHTKKKVNAKKIVESFNSISFRCFI